MHIPPARPNQSTKKYPRLQSKDQVESTQASPDRFTPSGRMGGPDSPSFYNGQVMTVREARELSGWTEPTTPTNVTKRSLEDYGLDPRDLLR